MFRTCWLQMLVVLTVVGTASPSLYAEPIDTERHAALAQLLDDFLAGASRGDRQVHERFWDDDLVYTSSAGTRTDKEQILRSMDDTRSEETPSVVYTADDVDIRLYGDTAVVAFTLVATPSGADKTPPSYYLNTGTFRSEGGQWRAVAWQATRVPE